MVKRRRSPYRHDVKQHLREGHVVHHYKRGEGSAPRQVIGARSGGGGGYSVTVIGGSGQETHVVQAGSYPGALTAGVNQSSISPLAIRLRRR